MQSGGKDVKELAWANYVAGYLSLRLVKACCKPLATVAGSLMSIGDTIFNLHRPLPELLTKRDFDAYLQHTLRRMELQIGARGRRGGELLPEAWGKTCDAMTSYSLYGYNLFRHAASTKEFKMLHLRDEDASQPSQLNLANCLSRALLGLLYSHEHGLRTRAVRYATSQSAMFMRLNNKRLPETGGRHFNHLSVDPGEDATMSQQYDPCDGSSASMAMAVEDLGLWCDDALCSGTCKPRILLQFV